MESVTVALSSLNGLSVSYQKSNPPELKLIKGELPPSLNQRSVERAVGKFIDEVDVKGDENGFYRQTLETIANATFLKGVGDFWMMEEDGEVMAYVIGSISKDIDGSLVYWMSQAWVDKKYRFNKCVKEGFALIRDHAKKNLCRHIVIISARGDSYCRWLGSGTHVYAHMLKQDI